MMKNIDSEYKMTLNYLNGVGGVGHKDGIYGGDGYTPYDNSMALSSSICSQ